MGQAKPLNLAARLFEVQGAGARLLPLEGLRGMSALLVYFVHLHSLYGGLIRGTALYPASRALSHLGTCGVDVFFALSGYIIYGRLLQRPTPYFRFLWNRIVRLYPAFTAVFLFYLCASLLSPHHSKLPAAWGDRALYLLQNYLMLPGVFPLEPMITVAWSLSYEVFFYSTLPLLVALLRLPAWPFNRRILFWLVPATLFFAAFARGAGWHPRFVMFICGIVLWETIRRSTSPSRLAVLAAPFVFLLALFLAGSHPPAASTSARGPLSLQAAIVLPLLFAGTFLLSYAAVAGPTLMQRLFSTRALRYFGNISYSYYLVHGVTLLICREFIPLPSQLSIPAYLGLAVIAFVVTLLPAVGLFLLIEKPFSLRPRLPSTPGK